MVSKALSLAARRSLQKVAATALLALYSSQPALAADTDCTDGTHFYVAKTGNDSNPGSLASPWLTIQKAANTLTAGQKVCVRVGTYEEPNFITPDIAYGGIKPQNSGSSGNPIIYEAYPGEAVIIDQDGTTTEAAGFYIKNKSYITIRGFEITDCWKGGVFVDYSDASGNTSIIVEENTIHNIQDDPGNNLGAVKLNDTYNAEVRNNRIYNVFTSSKNEAGVHSFDGTNILVENNEISDVEFAFFQKRSRSITDKGVTFRRNIVYDAEAGLQHGVSSGGNPGHFDVEVYENLFYDVNAGLQSSLASAGSQSDGLAFYNNTIVSNTGSEPRCIGIQYWTDVNIHSNICVSTSISLFDTKYSGCDRPVSYTEMDYNVYYTVQKFLIRFSCVAEQDEYTTLASFQSAESLDTHSVYDDPEFTNAATDDYTLAPSSPALTAGKAGIQAGAYGITGEIGIEQDTPPTPDPNNTAGPILGVLL